MLVPVVLVLGVAVTIVDVVHVVTVGDRHVAAVRAVLVLVVLVGGAASQLIFNNRNMQIRPLIEVGFQQRSRFQ